MSHDDDVKTTEIPHLDELFSAMGFLLSFDTHTKITHYYFFRDVLVCGGVWQVSEVC